jgi:hypothetical protein
MYRPVVPDESCDAPWQWIRMASVGVPDHDAVAETTPPIVWSV